MVSVLWWCRRDFNNAVFLHATASMHLITGAMSVSMVVVVVVVVVGWIR